MTASMSTVSAMSKLGFAQTLVGAGMDFLGSIIGASAERRAARLNARIMDMNARLLDMDAERTLLDAQRRANVARFEARRLSASQIAAMAANGIDVGSLTPAAVAASTEYMGELAAEEEGRMGRERAIAIRNEARNARLGAGEFRVQAAGISPAASALRSLVGGAQRVTASYASAQRMGAFERAPSVSAPRASTLLPPILVTPMVGPVLAPPITVRPPKLG